MNAHMSSLFADFFDVFLNFYGKRMNDVPSKAAKMAAHTPRGAP